MKRLVYTPRTEAYVQTDFGIYDVSDYITAGSVQRSLDQVSRAQLTLRNPDFFFTEHKSPSGVGPIFHPMDPIIVTMTRIKDRPVQVFTGYLDTTPYFQLFPGTITLQASCTLKRLQYTYVDAGLPFFNEWLGIHGWQAVQGLGVVNPDAAVPNFADTHSLTDSGLGQLLLDFLTQIGGWDENNIFIEDLPPSIINTVSTLFDSAKLESKEAQEELQGLLRAIIGTSSQGTGAPGAPASGSTDVPGDIQQYNRIFPHDGSRTGGGSPISFNAAAKIAESVGLPGITFAQIAQGESTLYPGATSTDGGYGLWQMTPRVQGSDTVRKWENIGSYFNPVNNAKQALVLTGDPPSVSKIQSNWFGTSHVTDWNKHYTGQ